MNQYESLIDPAEFGLVADYLRSPRTPIHHLLHVKTKAMLAPLAAELDSADYRALPPWRLPEAVERGLREATLLLSSRQPMIGADTKHLVSAADVPRAADCSVIYMPPFYLVHTRGLFEGTLIRPKTEQSPRQAQPLKPTPRIKI